MSVNQMTFEKNADGSVNSKINDKKLLQSKGKKAVDVDNSMSSTSENPVQNKVIDSVMKNKANLVNNKVPEEELPSYVDDVINGYYNDVDGKFYEHFDGTNYSDEITPEDGKIYVDLTTNVTFRWSGAAFVQVGPTGPVVIANPTLAGTEPNLEGLQVGNEKFKIPGGSGVKLYCHHIEIKYEKNKTLTTDMKLIRAFVSIDIYNDNTTDFTLTDVINYLYNTTGRLPATGYAIIAKQNYRFVIPVLSLTRNSTSGLLKVVSSDYFMINGADIGYSIQTSFPSSDDDNTNDYFSIDKQYVTQIL